MNTRKLRNDLVRGAVRSVLEGASIVARPAPLGPLAIRLMAAFGEGMARARGIRPVADAAALGPAWHRAFPSAKQVPIVGGDERTVFAEIHTPCPLRGTGDLEACHRMMAYDRAFVARAGGQFVVLRSQAEPGRTHCEVAIRRTGDSMDDLVQVQRPSDRRSASSAPMSKRG